MSSRAKAAASRGAGGDATEPLCRSADSFTGTTCGHLVPRRRLWQRVGSAVPSDEEDEGTAELGQ